MRWPSRAVARSAATSCAAASGACRIRSATARSMSESASSGPRSTAAPASTGTSTPTPASATASPPSRRAPWWRRIRSLCAPAEIRSPPVSSEPQAPAVAEPDSSDAALVDTLLEELGTSRVGLLAEFVRAYVRRVPAVLVAELGTSGLAAHVAHVYSFMSGREPGQLAVRAYNPDLASDGWESAGSVVEVAVEDAPFLVDTVTTEMHVHGLQVHAVVGVERSEDGRIEAITPARGAHRRESVMHFQVDRRLDEGALEKLRADLVRSEE